MNETQNVVENQRSDQQKSQQTKRLVIGLIACIGGLFFHLVVGSLYQWGIINIYVTSYLKTYDLSMTLEANAVAFPVMMLCIGIFMRLGLYLAEKTHPLIVLITCQILLSASTFISSYMTTIELFVLFYGIIFGLLVGMAFMIPLSECNKYFPGKKMYVNGVILIGTGSGSVVFGMFSYNYLNPDKIKPLLGYYIGTPQLLQIADKVPSLLRYLSLMYLCMGLIGIAMMAPVIIGNRHRQNQALRKKQQIEHESIQSDIQTDQQDKNKAKDQAGTLTQAFRSRICWIEAAIVLLIGCGLFLISGNYKTYVKASINDDQFLTIVGALGGVANGCTRFFWNLLFNHTGYKTVMLIIIGVSVSIFSTIRFTVQIPRLYLFHVFLVNSCIGGLMVTTPTVSQTIFGKNAGSNIYGFYWEIIALGNMISYLYVSNLTKTIGFDNQIYICMGMSLLAVPIIIFTKFQGPWKNPTQALEYCIKCQKSKIQEYQKIES